MRRLFNIVKILPAMCFPVLCSTVDAQEATPQRAPAVVAKMANPVSGTISDAATGKPVVGANITYKEFAAAISDTSGRFSIDAPWNDITLLITADGYQAKEIALKGNKNIVIQLQKSGFQSFYENITLPSATMLRSKLANAATTVKTDGAWTNIPETPDAYLQGRVAGLQSIRRSGTPGIGADLFLRGYSSLFASNQPMIIVDGVYYDNGSYGNSLVSGYYNNPLSFIDLKDIDDITVLKDGSSLYGAKAANGVIIITTARAREEATKIDAAVYGGISFAPSAIPVMGAGSYRSYLSEMLQSKGLSASEIQQLPYMNDDINNPEYYRYHSNTDWQNQVFSQRYTQNAYLKITGGDNIAKYGLSIGYLNSKSPLEETGLNRYNMRFNADLNLSKRLTASANIGYFRSSADLKNQGINPTTNPIYTSLVKAPFLPIHVIADNGLESPLLAGRDTLGFSNPAAIIQNMTSNNTSYRFVGGVTFNYQLSNSLTLGTTIAITSQKNRENFFIPERGIAPDTLFNGTLARNRSGAQVIKAFNTFNDTRISYYKAFNKRNQLNVKAGVRYNKTNGEQDYGLGFNSATDQLTGVGYGLNTLRQIGGNLGSATWLNMYVNADYNMADKYFITVANALDASSRFGHKIENAGIEIGGRRFGVFPSLGAAWLISSENFMAAAPAINLAKLRVSYGITGNDDIGNYTARSYYVSQNLLGVAGLVRGGIADERLQWEQVSKLNLGLDLALFNERLQITADVYSNKTSNMIVYEPGPAITGQEYIVKNSGAMKTNGWETAITGLLINQNKLKWQLGFNIAAYKTSVTELPAGSFITGYAGGNTITGVGNAPNVFYGYKTNGVFVSDAAAAASGLSTRNADGSSTPFRGGDMIFSDNGDKIIDEKDMQVIGNPNPDFFGGVNTRLTYGNWTLDALATFSVGGDVYNYARRQLESQSGYANQTEAVMRRWRTDGQLTDIPKATWGDPMSNSRFSDRWIEDASYLRLKTVSLSYKVPVKPTALKYIHIYATGNNLITFSKYLGYDPEFSAASGIYGQGADTFFEPQYKYVQLGVRFGL
ncbi:SusC/RagA family TonB-linked outer membrane protein [Niabella sp. 22666]|uniref:SusC/RagA family TonB-linked outer membrane protein n=1 Tax=Niabella sp. 22666 TaxID=3453954 RepID=UPI003F848AD9